MTTQEFSNAFDTLLNSYNTQAMFGEQTSRRDITLDEYEKSVFLTQAQDIVVKQYFDIQTDAVHEGFDGSERRQVDFSSLIQVKTMDEVNAIGQNVLITDPRNGNLGTLKFTLKRPDLLPDIKVELDLQPGSGTEVSVVVDGSTYKKIYVTIGIQNIDTPNLGAVVSLWNNARFESVDVPDSDFGDLVSKYVSLEIVNTTGNIFSYTQQELEDKVTVGLAEVSLHKASDSDTFDDRGILYTLPSDLLFMLNERLEVTNGNIKKKYVVIPIHYKEYDRQNSKPYNQPYKKQCWRLFQNISGFDTLSEIIPIWDAVNDSSVKQYKIRYVRRPRPIILVNLADGSGDLEIDGETKVTQCELNPILHMDILNTAVDLAVRSKIGGSTVASSKNSNNDG